MGSKVIENHVSYTTPINDCHDENNNKCAGFPIELIQFEMVVIATVCYILC